MVRAIRERFAAAGERVRSSLAHARGRASGWWRRRSLGTVFVTYLIGYLVLATAGTTVVLSVVDARQSAYYTVEVEAAGGGSVRASVETGPYIYNASTDELLPATEMDLSGDNPYAVFVGVKHDIEPDRSGMDSDEVAALEDDEYPEVNATMADVRAGVVDLYDWGLNFNYDPGFTSEEVLDDRGAIAPDRLAEYDRRNRAGRVDSVGLFEEATGVDLTRAFGEDMVSNVAYYADSIPSDTAPYAFGLVLNMVAPFVFYGGLAWVMFRRFYRLHIAKPLEMLADAATRIAGQDLDFEIRPAPGRELGALSDTLESMRSSLLEAQRELWRTAEERRRLNAAFAHDLRTPVTVLKGTVEIARLKAERGELADAAALDILAAQVDRLESYAAAMGGLSKLEDRAVERSPVGYGRACEELCDRVREIVSTRRPDLVVACEVDGAFDGAVLQLDMALVEEVLGNIVGNACTHAVGRVLLSIGADASATDHMADGEGAPPTAPSEQPVRLVLRVADDGPGFTPEALHRGCDPFFSEQKSAEHFGLGLNISATLAHLHGGSLELSNGIEGGACVEAVFDARTESDLVPAS